MPHMDVYEEVTEMKGSELTDEDRRRNWPSSRVRQALARELRWWEVHLHFRKRFQNSRTLLLMNRSQRWTLAEKIAEADTMDGQTLHEFIHDVKEASGLSPKEFFTAIYSDAREGKWTKSRLVLEYAWERLCSQSTQIREVTQINNSAGESPRCFVFR